VAGVPYLKRLRRRVAVRKPPADTKRTPAPFVVGAPRSGTTLLRLMLDAHPELAIPPETYFIPRAVKAWRRAKRPGRAETPLAAYTDAVTAHTRWPDFHLDADAYRRQLEDDPPGKVADAIRAFYEMYAEKAGKPRWGDKTPFYVRKMETIHSVLPEARFVHLIRDGRGVTLSIKDLWFGPNTIEEAAEFWVARIDQGREQARDLPHYMELRYEDLVREPERQLRRICEFVELPFDSQMLRYHELAVERVAAEVPPEEHAPGGRVVSTEERLQIIERTATPPDPTRIDRWKTDMAPDDRRKFEAIAGFRLRELGYPVEN
jgi:Sulfotransferase family